jgi:hypothetical protein
VQKQLQHNPPPQQQQAAQVPNHRAKMVALQQASQKNRRLAMQMANRPAVQTALKLKPQNQVSAHRIFYPVYKYTSLLDYVLKE